jgi:hypothetical protein
MQLARSVLIAGIACIALSSSACGAEKHRLNPTKQPKRSWAEVKEEIDQAFSDCYERIMNVARKRPRVASFGATSGGLKQPGISVMDIVVSRTPIDGPRPKVVVLDAYIERDYDVKTGQASSFRIVRHVVKDEGVEMISEVEKYFKDRKLPYEIVDRKKPAKRPGEDPQVSPAF